ncbi:MAG: rhomboid family intramembrane serine protease [Bacteroidota bacterium]
MAQNDGKRILRSLKVAGIVVGLLWVIHFALWLLEVNVGVLGIVPRSVAGLSGILTAPLVHGDIFHLMSNSAPLFFFTAGMLYFYPRISAKAFAWMYLMTGVWVWIAAHEGSHIGASGIVYALAGFLFFSGVFRRETRSIALSLVIAFFYGGMVWGVLPGQEGISWESHLFGLVAGAVCAFFYRKQDLPLRKKYNWEDDPEWDPNDDKAVWNYEKNWSGARVVYVPNSSGPDNAGED